MSYNIKGANWEVATDADKTQLRVDDVYTDPQGDKHSECICVVDSMLLRGEDPHSNQFAYLIAAAPELYAFAEAALAFIASQPTQSQAGRDLIVDAQFALAKAKGLLK